MKNCLAILFFFILFTSVKAQTDSTGNDTMQVAAPDLNFDVQAVDKVILLKWTVAFSDDLKGFDIERAENGDENFVKVGSKLAISKSSDADYDFVDATPKRNVLLRYRLKLISQNGSFSYSDFREAKLPDATFSARLKQNPVRNNLEIELVSATVRPATVIVIANSGQQIASQTFRLTEGANQFSISANNFPAGLYQLAIEAGTDRKTIPFIKE